jgi:RNA polymerase subunit RPABC4/transcription elongation factor Spt4
MSRRRRPGPNEQFCESCGTIIKRHAAVCPECGVSAEQPLPPDAGLRDCHACESRIPAEAKLCPDCGVRQRQQHAGGDDLSGTDAATWLGGGVLIYLGVQMITGAGVLGLAFPSVLFSLLFGLPLVLAGIAVLPPVRDTVDRPYSLTTFGRVHSVEESSVTDGDETCALCQGPVRNGVRREFKREYVFGGLSLSTSEAESGSNVYCYDCAPDTGTDGHTHDVDTTETTAAERN